MPVHECMSFPMQYLGRIDCSDPKFYWLGINELNIVAPLYDYFSELYLDYNDYNRPKILNPECFKEPGAFPDMRINGNVKFKKIRLTPVENNKPLKYAALYNKNDLVLCGVPIWEQYFELPKCPVTDKYMKFVCKIPSDEKVIIENPDDHINLITPDEYLDFGGGGFLYVFFQPESKIAYLELVCS